MYINIRNTLAQRAYQTHTLAALDLGLDRSSLLSFTVAMFQAQEFDGKSRDHRYGEMSRIVVSPERKRHSAAQLATAKADLHEFIDDTDPRFLVEASVPRY